LLQIDIVIDFLPIINKISVFASAVHPKQLQILSWVLEVKELLSSADLLLAVFIRFSRCE